MKFKKLKCKDFFSSMKNEELLEWENVNLFHLNLTTKDEILGGYYSEKQISEIHKSAKESLILIKKEKCKRNL